MPRCCAARQQVHQQVAQLLEARFPETVETQPELVARHYTAAGCAEQAVPYWQRAGQQASDRSAHLEAISHLTTGIELLKTLPETPEHTQQALSLHIALGAAPADGERARSAEVEHAYTQAYALCQQVGETPELAPVLFGLWRFYNARSQLHTARELGETLLRLAQRADDPRSRRPSCPRVYVVLPRRVAGCPPAPGGSIAATRQTSAVRRCSAWAKIRVLPAEPLRLDPLVAGIPGASLAPPRCPGVGTRAVASL